MSIYFLLLICHIFLISIINIFRDTYKTEFIASIYDPYIKIKVTINKILFLILY